MATLFSRSASITRLLTIPLLFLSKVLVYGKDIPENAIVAGEDRRRPLYIARTFYEVCFQILYNC